MSKAAEGFTASGPAAPMHAPPRQMTASEFRSRCAAAARMAMRGKSYSTEDRADCAAAIGAAILGMVSHPMPRPLVAGAYPLPAKVAAAAAAVDRDMSRTATAAVRRADGSHAVPTDLATFTRLAGMAANYRRTIDRDRKRDAADLTARAAEGFTALGPEALKRPVAPTAAAAHAAARDMLSTLGLPRLGKAYPLAYVAARTWVALEARTAENGRDIGRAILRTRDSDLTAAARELGYSSPEALGMALLRARKSKVPSAQVFSAAAHAAALGLTTEATPARKASATRMHSADMGDRANGWREHLPTEAHAPVTCRTIAPDTREMPAWARELAGTPTGHRLETAAALRRARAEARTAAEREALRASVGLPAMVR